MILKKERMPKETRRIMTSFAVQKFRELDELLGASKGKFLIDDELTVADLSVFTELTCADQFGIKVDKFPNVLKFYEEVRKVEEVKKYEGAVRDGKKLAAERFKL